MSDINIYCDESCHLEHDHQSAMILGAIWCPKNRVTEISSRLREIKARHGFDPAKFEIKWTKVSPAKVQFYLDLIDYFFDDDDLHFRGLIIPDKSCLDHASFGQSHDDWYYKMYFIMLKSIFDPENRYNIYPDIKDTRSAIRIKKLHEVLCNNLYDFSRQIITRLQPVRSHELEILQLADLLIGALSYINRKLTSSPAKLQLVQRIKSRSHYQLTRTTLARENKVNILRWQPNGQ